MSIAFAGPSPLAIERVADDGGQIVVAGVLERYQRRTARLTAQVGSMARELAGRGTARSPALTAGNTAA